MQAIQDFNNGKDSAAGQLDCLQRGHVWTGRLRGVSWRVTRRVQAKICEEWGSCKTCEYKRWMFAQPFISELFRRWLLSATLQKLVSLFSHLSQTSGPEQTSRQTQRVESSTVLPFKWVSYALRTLEPVYVSYHRTNRPHWPYFPGYQNMEKIALKQQVPR